MGTHRHLHIAMLSAGCNAFGVLMLMVLVVTATGIEMTPRTALAFAFLGFAGGILLTWLNVRLRRRTYERMLARSTALPNAVDEADVEIRQGKELAA